MSQQPNGQQQPSHAVSPPPEDDQLIRAIAALLVVDAGIGVTAAAISGLVGVPVQPLHLALQLANRGRMHRPRSVGTGVSNRAQAESELYYRAAYVLNAARRIWERFMDRDTPAQALKAEVPNFKAHAAAAANRQLAAAEITRLGSIYGARLGWYASLDGRETPECAAADGHNFEVGQRPVIGYPGSVHRYCRCKAGPPIAGASSVDQATRKFIRAGRRAA